MSFETLFELFNTLRIQLDTYGFWFALALTSLLVFLFFKKLFFYLRFGHNGFRTIHDHIDQYVKLKLQVESDDLYPTPFMRREAVIYQAKIMGHLALHADSRRADQSGGYRSEQDVLLDSWQGPEWIKLRDTEGTLLFFPAGNFKNIENLSIDDWHQKKLSKEQQALLHTTQHLADYHNFTLSEAWLMKGDYVTCMGQIKQKAIDGFTEYYLSPSRSPLKPFFLSLFEDNSRGRRVLKHLLMLGLFNLLVLIFWIDYGFFDHQWLHSITHIWPLKP
jgi:hypothetical protein